MTLYLKKAREFSIEKHGDQVYDSKPYVFHLDEVDEIISNYDELTRVIGYLHDVLEDTETTKDEIEKEFGVFISNCVSLVSDENGLTRKERKQKTNLKLSEVQSIHYSALLVKAADRLANVRHSKKSNSYIFNMYRKEHEEFKKAVYRSGLCDEIWKELNSYFTI